MPQDMEKLPSTFVQTTKAVNSLVFRSTRRLGDWGLGTGGSSTARPPAMLRCAALGASQRGRSFLLFLDELFSSFAHVEIFARFLIEARNVVVANGARHHAPNCLRAEIV